MFTHDRTVWKAIVLLVTGSAGLCWAAEKYGLGRPATPQEIAGWDIDVTPDGAGLPKGNGSVALGKMVYDDKCGGCHGTNGEGAAWDGKAIDRLAGGQGTLSTATPVKTVGSYWPYATTLYSYIYATMPFPAPQSLSPDEVYAVTAYVLYLNGIVGKDAVMNAKTLPKAAMPNRKNFLSPDPRPDVKNTACEKDCKKQPASG